MFVENMNVFIYLLILMLNNIVQAIYLLEDRGTIHYYSMISINKHKFCIFPTVILNAKMEGRDLHAMYSIVLLWRMFQMHWRLSKKHRLFQ